MAKLINDARDVTALAPIEKKTYTICSVITRPDEYRGMIDSFKSGGFTEDLCEYLYVDNAGENRRNAYEAYNIFLSEARSPYIILCHQDVLLLEDGRQQLDDAIDEINRIDPEWGLLGNAGASADGSLSIRISDPHGENQQYGGPYPISVVTLDENFIVVRRAANIGLSRDLSGFHFYGPDLCLIASVLGLKSYVINFHLRHKSGGNTDGSYYEAKRRFRRKYNRVFKTRWLPVVTRSPVLLSGNSIASIALRGIRKLLPATPLHRLKQ